MFVFCNELQCTCCKFELPVSEINLFFRISDTTPVQMPLPEVSLFACAFTAKSYLQHLSSYMMMKVLYQNFCQ